MTRDPAPAAGSRHAARCGVVGILLAAGAGRRMGIPKALVADGSWLVRATALLLDAGCSPVLVVLGAAAAEARPLLPADPRVVPVLAADWRLGMSASLRAGLSAAAATDATSALVTLVDLPRLPLAALTRVLAPAAGPGSLRQALWAGAPGHPVLLGRDHWTAVTASLAGDSGARAYLVAEGAEMMECGDLGDGADVDQPGSHPGSATPGEAAHVAPVPAKPPGWKRENDT
jgi:CTP:molybdopterin cytidylyltransferase MocA